MRSLPLSVVSATLVVLSLAALPTQTWAQQDTGPEHRLSYWVGEWTYEDSYETGTMVCEWLGTAFVLCHQVFTEPTGTKVPVLQVLGYDAEEEMYTMDSFWGHNGMSASAKGWVDDNAWTYVWGHNPRSLARLICVEETPSSVSLKWEYTPKGGSWKVANEATMTRVK